MSNNPLNFLGRPDFAHDEEPADGILFTNLGTPDAPTAPAVRRYLAQFLSDPRVIETPRWLWWLILHGIILRIRPRASAAAYREVWTEDGSPLLVHARRQVGALGEALAARWPRRLEVALGMRYGSPSIEDALDRLRAGGVRRLLVLPLYPQYSATTTGSTFDALGDALRRWRWLPELRFVTHYHDDPGYIDALARSIREARGTAPEPELVLFSFHGLPRRYLEAGDPYFCECHKTARLVAGALGLADGQWKVSFQSRVGRERWLEPYTEDLLRELAARGTRRVQVVCPGFSADCLETLEEIVIRAGDVFRAAGGETLDYVPALNEREDHIAALAALVMRHTADWVADEGEAPRAERARAMGATR